MTATIEHSDKQSNQSKLSVPTKVALAWILVFIALSFAGWVGNFAEVNWDFIGQSRYMLQAVIMASIVALGIYWLRKKIDNGSPVTIGINGLKSNVMMFLTGMGVIIVPFVIMVIATLIFGWTEMTINVDPIVIKKYSLGLVIVFLFEAFPEELIFRGYIYSNLNSKYKRWISAATTVALFVLLPLIIVPFQKYVLGLPINVGGSNSIQLSYVLVMIVFGAFTQYLRMITKSVWTGIGFHMFFVYFERLMGTTPNKLIQIDPTGNQTPMQIVFVASILIIFVILILYPTLSKRKMGWNEIEA